MKLFSKLKELFKDNENDPIGSSYRKILLFALFAAIVLVVVIA